MDPNVPLVVLDASDSEPLPPESEPHSPPSDSSESESYETDVFSEDELMDMYLTIRGVQLCFHLTHSTCVQLFTSHLYIHCILIYMVLLKCRARGNWAMHL